MSDPEVVPVRNAPSDIPSRGVLILFAHPAIARSRVNRVLAAAVRDLPGITFHDLYEAYPDFDIDVGREQGLLAEHGAIVLQHPFYWYSTPALVKEWEDVVLEHGWAYGRDGTALRGKAFLSAVTTGGREASYGPGGGNRYSVEQFLAPIEQTVRLCGMEWRSPFVVHGTHGMTSQEAERHAECYRSTVEALRDGRRA